MQDAELFSGYKIMNKSPFPTWIAYNTVEDLTVKSLSKNNMLFECVLKEHNGGAQRVSGDRDETILAMC